MTSFKSLLSQPPAQVPLLGPGGTYQGGATSNQSTATMNPTWLKWQQQIIQNMNASDGYGNPSVLLNSDFYWQRGISTPITESDGDGAYFAEKWQVQGASHGAYSITSTLYADNSNDDIGSLYYERVQISSWDGEVGNFYFYQSQSGAQFLRRYQNRSVQFTGLITNNQNQSIQIQPAMTFVYNTSPSDIITGGVTTLQNGDNSFSSLITTPDITTKTISGTPAVLFQLYIYGLPNNTGDFNLRYLKAEIADVPTVLYVDHALEKTRIDNS